MDDFNVRLFAAIAAAIPVCWVAWQLWHAIFGRFARKEDVDALKTGKANKEAFDDLRREHDDLEESVHKLKSNVVTIGNFRDRNDDVNKQLEDRRQDVKDIYKEIGQIRTDLNTGIGAIKDLLIQRLK